MRGAGGSEGRGLHFLLGCYRGTALAEFWQMSDQGKSDAAQPDNHPGWRLRHGMEGIGGQVKRGLVVARGVVGFVHRRSGTYQATKR